MTYYLLILLFAGAPDDIPGLFRVGPNSDRAVAIYYWSSDPDDCELERIKSMRARVGVEKQMGIKLLDAQCVKMSARP